MPASDILPPDLVDEIRALIPDLAYPSTFHLVRGVETPDGAGGMTTVERVIASGPCNLDSKYTLRGAQLSIVTILNITTIPWFVHMPYGTPVLPQDVIAINGRRFGVKAVVSEEEWGFDTTAVCEELH